MNKATTFQEASTCPRCGRTFTCGMLAGHGKCWCSEFPAQLPVPVEGAGGCYCPECLKLALAQGRIDANGPPSAGER